MSIIIEPSPPPCSPFTHDQWISGSFAGRVHTSSVHIISAMTCLSPRANARSFHSIIVDPCPRKLPHLAEASQRIYHANGHCASLSHRFYVCAPQELSRRPSFNHPAKATRNRGGVCCVSCWCMRGLPCYAGDLDLAARSLFKIFFNACIPHAYKF